MGAILCRSTNQVQEFAGRDDHKKYAGFPSLTNQDLRTSHETLDPKFLAEYGVGVGKMDEQHHRLFKMVDSLLSALAEGTGVDRLRVLVSKLVDYTSYHFLYEESLMEQFGYPGGKAHKAEHAAFSDRVMQQVWHMDFAQEPCVKELAAFLLGWLQNHIKLEDRKLAKFALAAADGDG